MTNPIIEAIRSLDNYVRGNARFTTTELVEPERIFSLTNRHRPEIREEVGVWTVMGSALHVVLREAAMKVNPKRYITEARYYATIRNTVISSQIDVYDREEKILDNYKVCSVWKFILADSPEWEQQLNIEACVLRMNGLQVSRVRNIAFLRDWNVRKARHSREPNYPKTDIHEVEMPLWSLGQQQQFIIDRMIRHEAAKDDPPVCTKKERWQRDAAYAVMKKNQKRAIRLYMDRDQAWAALKEAQRLGKPWEKFYIEERQVEPVRCLDYCPVQKWCDFGIAAMKKWRTNNDA